MSVDVGSVYRASWLVFDASGQPVNPSTASYQVTVGTGTPISVPVSLPPAQTGVLIADFQTTTPGLHRGDWMTGGPVSVGSDYFNVRAFKALCSLAEARDYLGVLDSRQDGLIRALMGAATKLTEGVVGTCVIRSYTDDWISGTERTVLQLPRRPLPSAASVTRIRSVYQGLALGSPSWDASMLLARPDTGTVYTSSRLPFWGGPWLADYQAGRTEVADNITGGYLDILWDLYGTQRGQASDHDFPGPQEMAQVESLIPPGYEMPHGALEQLEPDRMPAFG